MKKTLTVLLALAVGTFMAFGDDAAPVVKTTGYFDGGVQYFTNLGTPGTDGKTVITGSDITAMDGAINDFDVPIGFLYGVNVSGKGYVYQADMNYGLTGSATPNIWDAFVAQTYGNVTVEAGALNEYGFTDWINWDSYLARGKFGSLGVAVKYAANNFSAIYELPAYNPDNGLIGYGTNTHSANGQAVAMDGTARAAFAASYVAAGYNIPNIVNLLVGYHGNGMTPVYGNYLGAEVWFDADFSALIKNSILMFEYEDMSLGKASTLGADGENIQAFLLVGYNFGAFTLKNDFEWLQGNTADPNTLDFRIQPVISVPINSMFTFVGTVRVDNLNSPTAGKAAVAAAPAQNFTQDPITGAVTPGSKAVTAANAQSWTNSPVFWVNPELDINVGPSSIQVGAFVGNDYAGSWWYGNTANSAPQAQPAGSPSMFANVYVYYSFGF